MKFAIYDIETADALASVTVDGSQIGSKPAQFVAGMGSTKITMSLNFVKIALPRGAREYTYSWVAVPADQETTQWIRFINFPNEPTPEPIAIQHRPEMQRAIRSALNKGP